MNKGIIPLLFLHPCRIVSRSMFKPALNHFHLWSLKTHRGSHTAPLFCVLSEAMFYSPMWDQWCLRRSFGALLNSE